jgi:hypothetical protein
VKALYLVGLGFGLTLLGGGLAAIVYIERRHQFDTVPRVPPSTPASAPLPPPPASSTATPSSTPAPLVLPAKVKVEGAHANLRETAGRTGRIVETVPNGTRIEVLAQTFADGIPWYLVRTPLGVGWMHHDLGSGANA